VGPVEAQRMHCHLSASV